MSSNLYNKLIKYGKSDFYGFHMPGHKRNAEAMCMDNPFSFDITEIDGFDNLHEPEDIIKEEMRKATAYYESKQTYFLINGSSCGNLAAISAVADYGESIIICRNSHKSIYNAVELRGLCVEYIYPELVTNQSFFGQVTVSDVEAAMDRCPNAKAIVITSPTYEGIVSDIEAICKVAHERGIAVIVDAAHGSHFVTNDDFPQSAVKAGADIVIESLHKTMPSLTQTAVLHYNSELISQSILEKFLATYQSSSPSYVLIASICNCIDWMINEGDKAGNDWIKRLKHFRTRVKELNNIYLYDGSGQYAYDASKLVIIAKKTADNVNNLSNGKWLMNELRQKHQLEMEMASNDYVIAMTSPMDTDEAFDRLLKALEIIDRCIEAAGEDAFTAIDDNKPLSQNQSSRDEDLLTENLLKNIYSIRNKKACEIHMVSREDEGLSTYSKEYVYMYPPGIPLVVPGEIVDERLERAICEYENRGFEIHRRR